MKLFVWCSALLQVNPFMAQDEPFGAKIIPKYTQNMGEGPGAILSFETFLSLINRLLGDYITSSWSLAGGVPFLPPSDAYVRRFLYLLYTLINFVTQKLWTIKLRLWPQIKFFSSRGQEPWSCNSTTTFHQRDWDIQSQLVPGHTKGEPELGLETTGMITLHISWGKNPNCFQSL